jgi:hypothetical protein
LRDTDRHGGDSIRKIPLVANLAKQGNRHPARGLSVSFRAAAAKNPGSRNLTQVSDFPSVKRGCGLRPVRTGKGERRDAAALCVILHFAQDDTKNGRAGSFLINPF